MINKVEKNIQFDFSLAILKFLTGTASTCHATCQIKLDYTDRNRYHLKLEFVSLEFEGYNYSTKTGCSSARTAKTAKLYINCSRWRKGKLKKLFYK